nr:MAG TPA: hypothetical protein [Herelleviridae sp.]
MSAFGISTSILFCNFNICYISFNFISILYYVSFSLSTLF